MSEPWQRKIVDPDDVEHLVATLRTNKQRIATTNGSFDLLHAGHLHLLYEAAKETHCLLVGLNSDESVRKYKSADRPIIPLQYRLAMMAAIECVSYVTWFDETNPCALLEKIRPDIHYNSAEYGSDCIETPVVTKHGGKVELVERVLGLSTSEIIDRIVTTCVC